MGSREETLPSLMAAKAKTAKTTNSFAISRYLHSLFNFRIKVFDMFPFILYKEVQIKHLIEKHLFGVGRRRASFVLPIAIKAPFTLFATMPRTISRTPL